MDDNDNIIDVNEVHIPITQNEMSFWSSIYDSGGIDTISAEGSNDNVRIDLRSSILDDMENAGIFLSKFINEDSLKGGFTIPKGVIIENIISGNGNDILYENKYKNVIDGGDGYDTVHLLGDKQSYLIVRKDENTVLAINVENNNEKNTLKNIEKIIFNINEEQKISTIENVQYPYNQRGFMLRIVEKT